MYVNEMSKKKNNKNRKSQFDNLFYNINTYIKMQVLIIKHKYNNIPIHLINS